MDYLEYSRLLFKEFTLVSGILAGFSFSVAFQLLTKEGGGRVIYANLVLFFSAAVFLILSAVGGGMLFVASLELQGESNTTIPNIYHLLENIAGWSFFGGVFLFVSGIGCSGWIKSHKFGLFSTLLSIAFLLFAVVAFVLFGMMV
jgi:hypothetical protein